MKERKRKKTDWRWYRIEIDVAVNVVVNLLGESAVVSGREA